MMIWCCYSFTGHRYIELFLKSTPGGTSMGGVGGGGGGWSNSTNDMGGGMPRRGKVFEYIILTIP